MDNATYERYKSETLGFIENGVQYKLDVLYIIDELDTLKTVYRIINYKTGLMRDTTLETVQSYNINTSHAKYVSIHNMDAKGASGALREGINDFETWCRMNDRMDLLEEYDLDKNELPPDKVSRGSIKSVWWKCSKCGNSWQTILKNRTTSSKVGCPECRFAEGRYHKLVPGVNDFETWCKQHGLDVLLSEYSPNNAKKPNEIARGNATELVEWICSKCGKTYSKLIGNRMKGQSCPYCSRTGMSIPDMTLYEYYASALSQNEVGYRIKILGYEADVYLYKYRTVLDYRGVYWHLGKEDYDLQKEHSLSKAGHNQIIIDGDPLLSNMVVESKSIDVNGVYIRYIQFDTKDYEWLINTMNSIIGIGDTVNKEDVRKVLELVTHKKNNSIAPNNITETHPEVAARWDDELNGDFKPESVTYGTKYWAWFKCNDCKRSYYTRIRKQCLGQGCSYCNNPVPYIGINDILTTHPGILDVINFEESDISEKDLKKMKSTNIMTKFYINCVSCGKLSKRYVTAKELTTGEGYKCRYCKQHTFIDAAEEMNLAEDIEADYGSGIDLDNTGMDMIDMPKMRARSRADN